LPRLPPRDRRIRTDDRTPHENRAAGQGAAGRRSAVARDGSAGIARRARPSRGHRRLHATLDAFRTEHGFGRAISATQIGIARRFIALNLGEGPLTMYNPEIVWRSGKTFTLWDDCMSFPFLLVRVARDASITVEFDDETGRHRRWERLDRATSELLQHEIDHLDGVLALDRAVDREAIVSREVFESMPEHFAQQVDFP